MRKLQHRWLGVINRAACADLLDRHVQRKQSFNQVVFCKVAYGAGEGYDAVAHDRHGGRNLKDLVETVGDVDNADTLALEILHAAKKAFNLLKGERAGGFVQNEHLRVTQQAPKQFDKLLLRNGKRAGLSIKLQPPADALHCFHQLLVQLPLRPVETNQDIFLHGHIGKKQRLLRHHVYTVGERFRGLSHGHFPAAHHDLTAVVRIDTHDNFHQGAFAGAVAADQSQDLASVQVHADSFEHGVVGKRFVDVSDRQQFIPVR